MQINFKLQNIQDAQGAIDDIITQYESVLNSNFEKQERRLIQELFDNAKDIKKQLIFYKKMLSQQNLERLISERRRDKEKERQSLQTRWRECNQLYKKLQEQQKRLVSEHRENLVDATKLQQKIAQFQSYYIKLQQKVQALQSQGQIQFMAESRNYQSPYKRDKSSEFDQNLSHKKLQKLHQSQTKFFSNKYSFNSNNQVKHLNPFNNILNKISKPKINTLNLNNSEKSSLRCCDLKETLKGELFKFLLNPKIKQKIFQIVTREI